MIAAMTQARAPGIKVFLLLFLQKKKTLFYLVAVGNEVPSLKILAGDIGQIEILVGVGPRGRHGEIADQGINGGHERR